MKTFYQVVITLFLLVSWNQTIAQKFTEIPEFIFKNPVLVSGTSNQDGAIYRFNNIAPGYDATVVIISRSSSSVVLDTIDVAGSGDMGYDKALQPQLGVPGLVSSNLNWWMKFQLNFLQAGTNKPASINKFTATAIDLDGDDYSVQENLLMYKASSIQFSSPTLLTSAGISPQLCTVDNKSSLSKICSLCNGNGYNLNGGGSKIICKQCNGSGYLFSLCGHPWTGSDIFVQAPVSNRPGLDTSATENMAVFTYSSVTSFTFQYGAKSTLAGSNAGMRLNSIWFKGFSLQTPKILPVMLSSFKVEAEESDILLRWTTASEKDFSHFVVERSEDGRNFTDVALVFSYSDINAASSYNYKDKSVILANTVYYRLKMVDNTKEFSYSPIIELSRVIAKTGNLTIFPNPATDHFRISVPTLWQGKEVRIEIYNLGGQKIKRVSLENAAASEIIHLDATVSKGIYLVKSSCKDEQLTSRLIIL